MLPVPPPLYIARRQGPTNLGAVGRPDQDAVKGTDRPVGVRPDEINLTGASSLRDDTCTAVHVGEGGADPVLLFCTQLDLCGVSVMGANIQILNASLDFRRRCIANTHILEFRRGFLRARMLSSPR